MEIAEPLHADLCFIKFGGSLITEKGRPHTPRLQVIARLAAELAHFRQTQPGLQVLLGHGSGSFGHVPASKYGTRQGVHTHEDWLGFAEVWREANQLNRLVVDALIKAGLPAIALSPSAAVLADGGKVHAWNVQPLQSALQAGLLPVIHGDVVFDWQLGGTILSTEDLFAYLAGILRPARLLLAGIEPGVWADYPACTQLIKEITPGNMPVVQQSLAGSAAVDVTGGMFSKVEQSLDLVRRLPGLEVFIFSGEITVNLERVLAGQHIGTRIWSP